MGRLVVLASVVISLVGCAAPNPRGGTRPRSDGGAIEHADAGRLPRQPRDEDPPSAPPPDAGAAEPIPPSDAPSGDPPPSDAPPGDPSPGDACMGIDSHGRCEGEVAVWCGRDGRLRRRDCAAFGMVCDWVDPTIGYDCIDAGRPVPTPDGMDAGPGIDAGRDAGADAGIELPPPPPLDGGTAPPPSVAPLRCRTWPEQHTASNASWGPVLTDIVRHLPRSYGDIYYDADHVTYGHETSHGIHAHIRNYLNDTGTRANGFYVPGNQACLVREPRMRKSDVAPYIPRSLRWSRYATYISGSSGWDDTPLYVWDEWNAYVNGAEVGIDRYRRGLWRSGWRGTVDGVIEFVVYGIAVGMAAEAREPGYFEREPNFLAFMALQLERSMRAFREGQTIPVMAWTEQDLYYERLRTSSDAAAMRDWVRARFSAEWTARVMGF
jgi:hypothetical protein